MPVKIFFNVFADHSNTNAQSLNAREIALRLPEDNYHCTFFISDKPDPRLIERSNMSFFRVPRRKGLFFAFLYQMIIPYDITFYLPFLRIVPLWQRVASLKKWVMIAPIEGPVGYISNENGQLYHTLLSAYKRYHYLVPISDYVREEFSRETGLSTIDPIPVGVDRGFFLQRSERPSTKPLRVLFVGRMIKRKGLDMVVACAEKLPDVTFILAGTAYDDEDSFFYNDIRHRVDDGGLCNVNFAGAVSQERLRELMWESDILLHPSRVEGMPRVTLEAAAAGLPCVIFKDYRTPSVVDGVTGFQVATFDEMFSKLKILLEDKELRLRMGGAASQHALQFDWDVIVPQWDMLFQKVLAAR